jgi:hypothetical protein
VTYRLREDAIHRSAATSRLSKTAGVSSRWSGIDRTSTFVTSWPLALRASSRSFSPSRMRV